MLINKRKIEQKQLSLLTMALLLNRKDSPNDKPNINNTTQKTFSREITASFGFAFTQSTLYSLVESSAL